MKKLANVLSYCWRCFLICFKIMAHNILQFKLSRNTPFCRLDCVWSVFGLCWNCVWTVFGLCLNCVWTVFGLCLQSCVDVVQHSVCFSEPKLYFHDGALKKCVANVWNTLKNVLNMFFKSVTKFRVLPTYDNWYKKSVT